VFTLVFVALSQVFDDAGDERRVFPYPGGAIGMHDRVVPRRNAGDVAYQVGDT